MVAAAGRRSASSGLRVGWHRRQGQQRLLRELDARRAARDDDGRQLREPLLRPCANGAEGVSVGRSYRDAPEIDGLVLVEGVQAVGEFAAVHITGAMEYDLAGRPVVEPAGQ